VWENDLIVAQVCWAAQTCAGELLGLHPAESWDELPPWRQELQVAKVRCARLGGTLEQLHQVWCERWSMAGYRWGPQVDHVRKTHPGLVPWDGLPEPMRAASRVFHALVLGLSLSDLFQGGQELTGAF
jgi:RyR domain